MGRDVPREVFPGDNANLEPLDLIGDPFALSFGCPRCDLGEDIPDTQRTISLVERLYAVGTRLICDQVGEFVPRQLIDGVGHFLAFRSFLADCSAAAQIPILSS